MAGRKKSVRTFEDLKRAVRSVARHFKADTVYLIGSQAILASWPDAPLAARMSVEFDAYPGNAKLWEAENAGSEASEEINAIFGFGSNFHLTFGFYIDGVDYKTATLPPGWKDRAARLEIKDDGKVIVAVAPAPNDLIVSKLVRLEEKDRAFVKACHEAGSLDLREIRTLLRRVGLHRDLERAALSFLDSLTSANSKKS